MGSHDRPQDDTGDRTDPGEPGPAPSAFSPSPWPAIANEHEDDDSRYLYSTHDDLWYDWTTSEFSQYDPDSQLYMPIAMGAEQQKGNEQNKGKGRDYEEDEYDPHEDEQRQQEQQEAPDGAPLRLVVVDSTLLTAGHVVVVDPSGLTVGRDRSWDRHRLRLPELAVSKFHCQLYFDSDIYYIIDLGSRNGTFVNGTRLSEPKTSSIPHPLHDIDMLQIGSSTFQVHYHKLGWQCDHCIIGPDNTVDISQGNRDHARASPTADGGGQQQRKVDAAIVFRSKELREKEWMDELRRRKRMFAPPKTGRAHDAADRRRRLYASTTVPEYMRKSQQQQKERQQEPAPPVPPPTEHTTVHTPVQGIGDAMLRKMGWKQGQALGRTGADGITVPITPKTQTHRAGLGKNTANDAINYRESHKTKIPRITRERYDALG